MKYDCVELVDNLCTKFVKSQNSAGFFEQFANLTYADVGKIFVATALYFAVCWVFRELPFFVKQR